MTFSTLTFLLLFLPLTILAHYAVPKRLIAVRNAVLLAASVFFYAWGEPANVFLILLCVGATYGLSDLCAKKTRWAMFAGVAVNLAPLLLYKYADLLLETVGGLTGLNLPRVGLALPAGISFYTFQVLTYWIDLYRGRVERQGNPVDLALYVFLFPQLIAGPIVRYSDVAAQLRERSVDTEKVTTGVYRFSLGLAKKMLIANQAGYVVKQIQAAAQPGTAMLWLGVVAYGVQIYYDFSGYSDMAIGLGKLFGFDFLENFNKPYAARSITDFWRRWHISLSTFFRDYIYIPLGGNRVSRLRNIFNLFVVWFLTGLWHGAYWNYALWGVYYFALLILEKYAYGRFLKRLPGFLSWAISFALYMFGWAIFMFESNSLAEMAGYLGRLFGAGGAGLGPRALGIQGYLPVLAIGLLGSILDVGAFWRWLEGEKRLGNAVRALRYGGMLLLFMVSVLLIVSESFNPFIYFRF